VGRAQEVCCRHESPRVVRAPPGVVMVALPTIPRNASWAQSEGRAREVSQTSAAKDIIEAGTL
jgi:hypothetical protein